MRIFERFLDWFRPGWRRSDPEERLRAVERLGEEDGPTLVELARRDGDGRVRWAAARKIHDPDLLAGMAVDDPDPTLRRAAADRAWHLFVRIATSGTSRSLGALERRIRRGSRRDEQRREAFEAMRRRAVARLIDPQLLALVARNADDPMTRREAVLRIADAATLRAIALDDPSLIVGQAVVERLDDEDALVAIVKGARNAGVRGAAHEKLRAGREDRSAA